MDERMHTPFPKKGGPRISQKLPRHNISIAAKIYNALIWNRIEPEIDNILRKKKKKKKKKKKMASEEIDPRPHKY